MYNTEQQLDWAINTNTLLFVWLYSILKKLDIIGSIRHFSNGSGPKQWTQETIFQSNHQILQTSQGHNRRVVLN